MKIDTVSFLLGMKTPIWAPEDEGGSGGSTDGSDADNTQTDGAGGDAGSTTALGGEQTGADDASTGADQQGTDAGEKGDEDGNAKGDDAQSASDENDDDAKLNEVPEDGAYTFELPEGVELDDEDRAAWSEQFKELGLTRGQAAKLVEAQAAKVAEQAKADREQVLQQQKEHEEKAKADPEIGGDKWEESKALANRGLEMLGGSEIKNLILATGNGNNPEMIRELRRIGQLSADDTFENQPSHTSPPAKETSWYGDTTPDSKKG